jgi:hypothetical protein
LSKNKLKGLLRWGADSYRTNSPLDKLLRRVLDQEHKTNILRSILPVHLSAQFEVANVRGKKLIIHATNASWATRLRFENPKLLDQLRELQEFSRIEEIVIRSMSSLEPSTNEHSDPEKTSSPPEEPLAKLADRDKGTELERALQKFKQARPTNSSGRNSHK